MAPSSAFYSLLQHWNVVNVLVVNTVAIYNYFDQSCLISACHHPLFWCIVCCFVSYLFKLFASPLHVLWIIECHFEFPFSLFGVIFISLALIIFVFRRLSSLPLCLLCNTSQIQYPSCDHTYICIAPAISMRLSRIIIVSFIVLMVGSLSQLSHGFPEV